MLESIVVDVRVIFADQARQSIPFNQHFRYTFGITVPISVPKKAGMSYRPEEMKSA